MSSTINSTLMLEIADIIEKQPHRLDMSAFFSDELIDMPSTLNFFNLNCKTTACVAGWASVLRPDKVNPDLTPYNNAVNILLKGKTEYDWIFYPDKWPSEIMDEFYEIGEIGELHDEQKAQEQAKYVANLLREFAECPYSLN